MAIGKNEFLGVAKGFRVTFEPCPESRQHVGIVAIDEGVFENGAWLPGRRLNGDEDNQGKDWRFNSHSLSIDEVSLYRDK